MCSTVFHCLGVLGKVCSFWCLLELGQLVRKAISGAYWRAGLDCAPTQGIKDSFRNVCANFECKIIDASHAN